MAYLMTSAEVCRELQIHRNTLTRWCAAKILSPTIQSGAGGRRWFRRRDILTLRGRALPRKTKPTKPEAKYQHGKYIPQRHR